MTKMTVEAVDELLEKHLPPYYDSVGRIAYVWSMLEHALDRIIWDLADTNQVLGACMTTQMNGPSPRIRALLALLEVRGWPDPLIKRVKKFDGDARKWQEERNRAVHDPFFVTLNGNVRRQRTATINNKVVLDRYEPSLSSMQEVFEQSRRLLLDLNDILDAIRQAIPLASKERIRRLKMRYGPFNESRIPVQLQDETEE
jgi:hypothetical protein